MGKKCLTGRSRTENLILLFLMFTSLLVYVIPFTCSGNLYEIWMHEDGIIEALSALYWFVSSCLCFVLYANVRLGNDFFLFQTRRNLFFLFLGILFFIGGAEEISWGQRIFGFQTPEALSRINYQNEINLHNIDPLSIDRLFSLFWFLFCFIVPLAARIFERINALCQRVVFPLVPLEIGVMFPLNYLFSKLLEFTFSGQVHNAPIELKEHNFALLFLAVSISFVFCSLPGRRNRQTNFRSAVSKFF